MQSYVSALNARPESIEDYLKNYIYVIPDYQRPYSWGNEECTKLWEDIINHFNEDDRNYPHYFIGNTIIYQEEGARHVVDGQQRLITLLLLIKALLLSVTSKRLERCIYKFDGLDETINDPKEIKIHHKVHGENEHEKLKSILLDDNDQSKDSLYMQNYNTFKELISEFLKTDATKKEQFVKVFIENIILLPIECTDFDSALTIFQTINDRGMDLSDEDIFKAILYSSANNKSEKEDFISQWDVILDETKFSNYPLKNIFTNYMHVLRGMEGNIQSLRGLRKFFTPQRLEDWKKVVESLRKMIWGWNYLNNRDNGLNVKHFNLFQALLKYPNDYWQYPLMVYIHQNIEYNEAKKTYILEEKEKDQLESLIEIITRYYFCKWSIYRGINHIKNTTFKLVADIAQKKGKHADIINDDLISIKTNDIKREICNNNLGKGQLSFCILSTTLNAGQTQLIPENISKEHILPKKWHKYKYSGWEQKDVSDSMEMLGNLLALEIRLNNRSQNNFFSDKKLFYQTSSIADARDIDKNFNDWTCADFKKRQQEITKRLMTFLTSKGK